MFDPDADLKEHDILAAPVFGKDLVIDRVSPFHDLSGVFHHYEIYAVEHEGNP